MWPDIANLPYWKIACKNSAFLRNKHFNEVNVFTAVEIKTSSFHFFALKKSKIKSKYLINDYKTNLVPYSLNKVFIKWYKNMLKTSMRDLKL